MPAAGVSLDGELVVAEPPLDDRLRSQALLAVAPAGRPRDGD